MSNLEPAFSIVNRLGGVAKISATCGVHRTRVYGWMRAKGAGGTGGTIPQKHHLQLLDLARRSDVPLTAADFLPRKQAEPAP